MVPKDPITLNANLSRINVAKECEAFDKECIMSSLNALHVQNTQL